MPEYFNEVRMPPAVNDCSYRTLPTTSTLLLDLFAPRYPPTLAYAAEPVGGACANCRRRRINCSPMTTPKSAKPNG